MDSILYGYCRCGCGQKTKICRKNNGSHGEVSGEPLPYLPQHKARERNREYVAAIRSRTACAICGEQPIDWHREEHAHDRYSRVGALQKAASLKRIEREISLCTPLCRRCHMTVDGRLNRFIAAGNAQRKRMLPPKPCGECGRPYKPLRRGLCGRCYDHTRRPLKPAFTPPEHCPACGKHQSRTKRWYRGVCEVCYKRIRRHERKQEAASS